MNLPKKPQMPPKRGDPRPRGAPRPRGDPPAATPPPHTLLSPQYDPKLGLKKPPPLQPSKEAW